MTIAQKINDLVDGLITALNARNAPGPSDFQMWLAAGNTGTLADYRTAMLGGDSDYATQFNNALGLAPTAGAATEAQAGVTQFATLAETKAATLTTKAVSPANLAAYSQYASGIRVTGISGLLALMQSATPPPAGSIIHASAETYFAIVHYGSVWRVTNAGKAEPLNGVPILLDTTTSMGNLGYNYNSPAASLWNRWLNFDNRATAVYLAGIGPRQEYRWDANSGTGNFRLWPGSMTYSSIQYTGGSDQQCLNNDYLIYQFDTVEFDGLYADYLGTSAGAPKTSYRLNYAGRYDISWRFAMTNSDNSDYYSTIYNEGKSDNYHLFKGGVLPDVGLTALALGRYWNANDTLRCALFKSGTNQNWIRRGNTATPQTFSNRPTLTIRYLGWD